jgi:hypothetical protein
MQAHVGVVLWSVEETELAAYRPQSLALLLQVSVEI